LVEIDLDKKRKCSVLSWLGTACDEEREKRRSKTAQTDMKVMEDR
jgi:hypothetical protein